MTSIIKQGSDKTTEESSVSGNSHGSSSGGLLILEDLYDEAFNDEDDESFACSINNSSLAETKDTNDDDDEDDDDEEGKVQFAKKENTAVLRLRLLVFDFLIVATIAISLIVYFMMTGAERTEYESQYETASQKVIQAFHGIANDNLAAAAGMSLDIAVHGEESSRDWPFVTLSRFQERAATPMTQSGALYLQVNPMVSLDDRQEWEQYTTGEDSHWIQEGLEYQENIDMLGFSNMHQDDTSSVADRWPIWFRNVQGLPVTDKGKGPYLPTWQTSPILDHGQEINENILKNKFAYQAADLSFASQSVVVDKFSMAAPGDVDSEDRDTSFFALLMSIQKQEMIQYPGDPLSQVFYPVFNTVEGNRTSVAIMAAWIRWMDYFQDILPSQMMGIHFLLQDSCGGEYAYVIDGAEVRPLGEGPHHDRSYAEMMRNASFASIATIEDGSTEGLAVNQDHCTISIEIYPSDDFHSIYNTNVPAFMTAAVVVIFVCTAMLFIVYDRLVERRQRLVLASAEQTNAIVSSLFPKQVRDRLMQQVQAKADSKEKRGSFSQAPNRRLKGYLDGNEADDMNAAPIADLFPHCTVLFADISGFTAWSSTRDPAQVFILLQTVYQAFDKIAKHRKVFKVETIGDSYVAVTGLPEPQETHAVIMCRFAAECRVKMNELTAKLETSLGPDTGELTMRFGLHSGPVTAGVLRGERARFQLFGDTVNTAARMESTGQRDMIQVSHVTYGLLVEAGKQAWVKPRLDAVKAKGKGTMRTYWLQHNSRKRDSVSSGDDTSTGNLLRDDSVNNMDLSSNFPSSMTMTKKSKTEARLAARKQARLVDWMCELFHDHIRQILASRKRQTKPANAKYFPRENSTALDEVAEVIFLPQFDEHALEDCKDKKDVHVGPVVMRQLHEYISMIASQYLDNAFHNFEHACHVTMATNKFLKRIVTPDIAGADGEMASKLHNYTHGINSDPLTLLAIVFSALIHDVDHRGVSNGQLAKEDKEMGDKYRNKSVAEQHSLDLSWDLLMDDKFQDLRNCIFASDRELHRFRQVIVNVVLATDIFDPELNGLRKKRWERAFGSECSEDESHDLRATIVIEHIIQASDVSHTMQHWHIYRKWNRRLFHELYKAYLEGRMEKDPSSFWYRGEIGFFDNYIIPLAKKLKDCQVFGVSSDECLNYAIQNRDEWKERGQDIVHEMMEEVVAMNIQL